MKARRITLGGAVALLLSVLVSACRDTKPTGPASGMGTVTGTVALVKTGEGVANAIVALRQDGVITAVAATGADGGFSFENVAAGDYDVTLTGLELTGVSLRNTSFDPMVQRIRVDGTARNVVFAAAGLVPARIVGYVQCGGAPVVGAELRVVGGETDVVVTTNAQGKYGAIDLATGNYTVMLEPESLPCDVGREYGVAAVRIGQQATLDFTGP